MLGTLWVADNSVGQGGRLYLKGSSGFLFCSFIINNMVTNMGGSIFVMGALFSVVESNVTNNQPDDIACTNGTVQEFRPITMGEVTCLPGCGSALCPA